MEPIDKVCPSCGRKTADLHAEPHHLKPGTSLRGRYRVGSVLGEGGFGITYVGKDIVLERKVAIKEFFMSGYVNRNHAVSSEVVTGTGSHGAIFERNREKFLLEARTLAKFDDEPGIVGIRDFFQENNTAYIVMDFLDGVNLREYIKKVGKISGEQLLHILEPVFHSLANVHKQSLIHRDISPDNIMMTKDGKVKLLDFGAAREVSQDDVKSLSIILKPGYAPEEQYRSKGHQGPWTDVYALCATMYRCITGIVPDDAMERLYADKVIPPINLNCDCTPAMSAVIMKGLSIRKDDRYQSVPELWAAFHASEEIRVPSPLPRPVPEYVPERAPVQEDDAVRRTVGSTGRSVPELIPKPVAAPQPERQPVSNSQAAPWQYRQQQSAQPVVSKEQAGIVRFWQRWFPEIAGSAVGCQIWYGNDIVPQVRANAAVYIANQRVNPDDIIGILASERPWGAAGILVTTGYLYLGMNLVKHGLIGRSTSRQVLVLPYRQLFSAKARGNKIVVQTRDGRSQEAQLPAGYNADALARALNDLGGFLRSGKAYSG